MIHLTKSNSKHCGIAILAILGAIQLLPARSAQATVMDLDNLAALNTDLLHQYTFEGASVAIREEDKKGTLHLDPLLYGSATAGQIQYQTGFDATSTAVVTYRLGGDRTADGGDGAGLSSGAQNIAFPGTYPKATFEMLVRPDQASVTGSHGSLGFVAMTRETAGIRGFFAFQGSTSGPAVDSFSTLAGDGTNVAHEQTLLADLDPGHWYYFATIFESKDSNGLEVGGLSKTLITSYRADLTLNETSLTSIGSVLVDGPFTNGGGGLAPLGVGIGDLRTINSGNPLNANAFPGGIDSLSIYQDLLSEATLQSHLDALWLNNQPINSAIPEPNTFVLLLGGLLAIRRSKRKRVV